MQDLPIHLLENLCVNYVVEPLDRARLAAACKTFHAVYATRLGDGLTFRVSPRDYRLGTGLYQELYDVLFDPFTVVISDTPIPVPQDSIKLDFGITEETELYLVDIDRECCMLCRLQENYEEEWSYWPHWRLRDKRTRTKIVKRLRAMGPRYDEACRRIEAMFPPWWKPAASFAYLPARLETDIMDAVVLMLYERIRDAPDLALATTMLKKWDINS
jgi:hypothetical protein